MADIIELGKRVKSKYPGEYDHLSDQEVGARVKARHPEDYGFFTDVAPQTPPPSSGGGFFDRAKSIGQGVLDSLKAATTSNLMIPGVEQVPVQLKDGKPDFSTLPPADAFGDVRGILNLFKDDPYRAVGQALPFAASGALTSRGLPNPAAIPGKVLDTVVPAASEASRSYINPAISVLGPKVFFNQVFRKIPGLKEVFDVMSEAREQLPPRGYEGGKFSVKEDLAAKAQAAPPTVVDPYTAPPASVDPYTRGVQPPPERPVPRRGVGAGPEVSAGINYPIPQEPTFPSGPVVDAYSSPSTLYTPPIPRVGNVPITEALLPRGEGVRAGPMDFEVPAARPRKGVSAHRDAYSGIQQATPAGKVKIPEPGEPVSSSYWDDPYTRGSMRQPPPPPPPRAVGVGAGPMEYEVSPVKTPAPKPPDPRTAEVVKRLNLAPSESPNLRINTPPDLSEASIAKAREIEAARTKWADVIDAHVKKMGVDPQSLAELRGKGDTLKGLAKDAGYPRGASRGISNEMWEMLMGRWGLKK